MATACLLLLLALSSNYVISTPAQLQLADYATVSETDSRPQARMDITATLGGTVSRKLCSSFGVTRTPSENPDRDMETIEAEVAFSARQAGQWPQGQAEIHFHPSTKEHREIATAIWRSVTLAS